MSQFYPIDADPDGRRSVTPDDVGYDGVSDADASPFQKIHLLLRGRYHWMALLSILLAALGSVGAYLVITPLYTNVGIISIKPVLEHVLYQSEDSRVMPMFDAFVGSQVELIRSQRVLEMAQEIQTWKDLDRGMTPEAQAFFTSNLTVKRLPNSQLVLVSFTDSSRDATQIAVTNVIDAYMRIYGEQDAHTDNERMRLLEQERSRHTNELRTNRQLQMDRSSYLGYEALSTTYRFKLEQLNEIEKQLNDTRLALAASGQVKTSEESSTSDTPSRQAQDRSPSPGSQAGSHDPGSSGDPATANQSMALNPRLSLDATVIEGPMLSAEEIATKDRQMQDLLSQKKRVEAELQRLMLRLGDRHPKVIEARSLADTVDQAIEDHVIFYNKIRSGLDGSPDSTAGLNTLDVASLRLLEGRLQTLYNNAVEETRELGRKKLELENLRDEAEIIQARLGKTLSRIEQLNVESRMRGRIEKITYGKPPETPVNSGKRKQMAVLGGIGGAGFGVAVMFLIGKLDRRLRSSDHAKLSIGNVRLLSILPVLPRDLSDPENAFIAGQSVHHIRTMLQVGSKQGDRKAFAITSPASGTGKTSLALALALSYAGSKTRTLLIDCDLAGAGLSQRMGKIARPSLRQILVGRGLIEEEQWLAAEQTAAMTDTSVEQAILNLCIVSESDLETAVDMAKARDPMGLLEALEGEPLANCVAETDIENLTILPIGIATTSDMSRVSPDLLRRLIDDARKQFDTILIDTGPVPGSVESAMAAEAADGVILIVSRGESEPTARGAMAYLQSYGARIEGLVFNRAQRQDIARSAFSMSVSINSRNMRGSDSIRRLPVDEDPEVSSRTERFGPVAQAVAQTSRVFVRNGHDPGDDQPDQ